MTTSSNNPTIKGDRVCLRCKGICHENSVRDVVLKGYGFRASYWCSIDCLIRWKIDKVEKKNGNMYGEEYEQFYKWVEEKVLEDFKVPEDWHSRYEYVDVITR